MSNRPPFSNLNEPNGLIVEDSVPRPAVQGFSQPGDTNGNPDLGRRRPTTLARHFPNSPNYTSGQINNHWWNFMKDKINEMAQNAPDLNELRLEGSGPPPGLDHPLMPNLSAVVEDPDGPQTPTGMAISFHNDAADTATPDESPTVNPSRNPVITTAARSDSAFIEGRMTRWS